MLFSVIIPAYNEEQYIKKAISSAKKTLDELEYTYEIIVANNNSTDKTVDIAKKVGCRVINQKVQSISRTRNAGAKKANGELLIFLDADSRVTKKLVTVAIKEIENRKAISAITSFDQYPTWQSYGVWFYNFFSILFGLGVGQFIMIKKKDFNKVGGFNEEYFAFEEIAFFRNVRKVFGKSSVKILTTPIISSSRKFEKGKSNTPKFLFQLILACLGFDIGKRKDKLDFWYKNV